MADENTTKNIDTQYPFEYTLSLINGKWKIRVLYLLYENGVLRYGELKKEVMGITHKMLAKQLKEMEVDELIVRTEFPQIPPKVEYSLTEKGRSLIPVVNDICNWGEAHRPVVDGEVIVHRWHLK